MAEDWIERHIKNRFGSVYNDIQSQRIDEEDDLVNSIFEFPAKVKKSLKIRQDLINSIRDRQNMQLPKGKK